MIVFHNNIVLSCNRPRLWACSTTDVSSNIARVLRFTEVKET